MAWTNDEREAAGLAGSPVQTLRDRNCPQKSWGWEEWIVNNDLYCGKRLHFVQVFGSTSLHFHMKKHETMFVERGRFEITVHETKTGDEKRHDLYEGESIVIVPGTPHRIKAMIADSILVEFSTHHEDDDSYRIMK